MNTKNQALNFQVKNLSGEQVLKVGTWMLTWCKCRLLVGPNLTWWNCTITEFAMFLHFLTTWNKFSICWISNEHFNAGTVFIFVAVKPWWTDYPYFEWLFETTSCCISCLESTKSQNIAFDLFIWCKHTTHFSPTLSASILHSFGVVSTRRCMNSMSIVTCLSQEREKNEQLL